ncbi:MAG: glycosyltransferase [Patescibacteria group bacterium]
MKVLMITGDKKFAASPRFALQAAQVEKLSVVYWGRGSLWPKIPKGQFSAQGGPALGWDVVTAQDPFWRGLFAWRVARRLTCRLNLQVHTGVLNILGKFILRRADSVRVVSEKIKKQVEAIGVRAPVTVLPVYVDIERFRGIARPSESDSQGKTVLWVGRFEDEKDPLLALEVVQKVPGAKLVMLGAGSLEAALKTKAKGLPVEFAGWQDPAAYLAQADVVLCTSKHESWGASIVEALAAGVPVVAPDVGIAKEAGATVVPREGLAGAVIEALRTGALGRLQLPLLSKEEWAKAWVKTL